MVANPQNLHPVRTEEEARTKGRAGGIKSGKVRRERRQLAEDMKLALSMTQAKGKSKDLTQLKSLSKAEIEQANLTIQQKLIISMLNQALKGNVRAFEDIRDLIGEDTAAQTASPLDALAEAIKAYIEQDGQEGDR